MIRCHLNSLNNTILLFMLLFFILLANSLFAFSHQSYNKLLQANVKNGLVYYPGFKSQSFKDYLESIAQANINNLSHHAQLAFYINAYNSICIQQVLDQFQLIKKSPEGVLTVSHFFDQKQYKVAGQKMSLNELENKIIRPLFKEPLIHFGLVCAAKGCPQLQNIAYTEKNVIKLLMRGAKKYLKSRAGFQVSSSKKIVYLSKIFQWYHTDFGENKNRDRHPKGSYAHVRRFIIRFKKGMNKAILNYEIQFLDYNWQLNLLG